MVLVLVLDVKVSTEAIVESLWPPVLGKGRFSIKGGGRSTAETSDPSEEIGLSKLDPCRASSTDSLSLDILSASVDALKCRRDLEDAFPRFKVEGWESVTLSTDILDLDSLLRGVDLALCVSSLSLPSE